MSSSKPEILHSKDVFFLQKSSNKLPYVLFNFSKTDIFFSKLEILSDKFKFSILQLILELFSFNISVTFVSISLNFLV